MRNMFLALGLLAASPAYSIDVKSAKAVQVGDYVFYESPAQPHMLLFVGKTVTEVVSKVENTTTSGQPVRSWVIRSKWRNDPESLRQALATALQLHPEWSSFAKDSQPLASTLCRFKLQNPNVKVSQGGRTTSLDSTGDLCTFVVHTKDEGDQQLLDAVAHNDAIDSGVTPLTVRVAGVERKFINASQIADQIRDILGTHEEKPLSATQVAFYLGASIAKYQPDELVEDPNELFNAANRAALLESIDKLTKLLFRPVPDQANTYKFRRDQASGWVTTATDQVVVFDPQGRV